MHSIALPTSLAESFLIGSPAVALSMSSLSDLSSNVVSTSALPSHAIKASSVSLSFPRVWENHSIVVCMGSGGVGKTTIASTLALQGSLSGKRVLALTIDPARRLANALGMSGISSTPTTVPTDKLFAFAQELGYTLPPKASVDVLMVEQKTAFDELIFQYAGSPAHARRILHDPIYQQMSTALAGSHEYAALATLYQYQQTGTYDLIILDTPPTLHAIDFLESPFQLGNLLNSSSLQWFMKPYLSGAKWAGLGGALVMKGLSHFVGSNFLEQIGKFLYEFQPILQEFQKRAKEISALLQTEKVCFLLVCAPEPNRTEEIRYLINTLQERHFSLKGIIINRVYPDRSFEPQAAEVMELLRSTAAFQFSSEEAIAQTTQKLIETYQEQQQTAQLQQQEIKKLTEFSKVPFCQIPLLLQNVDGLSSFVAISKALQGS